MPNLGGFEVVGELTVEVLNQILRGAWDNNIIPHSVDITAGAAFGPYHVADGVCNIARDALRLDMDPPVNGVRIVIPCVVQVEISNPPIPSAQFFDLAADVVARVPIAVLPGTIHVAAMLDTIPRANVSATVTSPDPIPPLTVAAVADYVHARYSDGTIPHLVSQNGVALGGVTADAWLDIYDDPARPTHQITVVEPGPGQVAVKIPFHLKLSNLSVGLGPCGVVGKFVLTSDLVAAPGSVISHLSTAAVTLEGYAAAPLNDAVGSYDAEGSNYTTDNTLSGGHLETALKAELTARATLVAQAIGDVTVVVPTLDQIESFIADQAYAAIVGRGNVPLWTPSPPAGGGVAVTDVRPIALPDAIAFCLNNPGGDTGVIGNFIPAARSCAIALDGGKVVALIREQIAKPESDGGFGGIPHTFPDVDGHRAKLTRLDISLRNGSIHLEGDVTVIDAIAGSIDVDASFGAEVGLEWIDQPDGGQMLHPFVISKDVDLSVLAWILSFLVGFISFGLVGGIVGVVVTAIVESVAEKLGGKIIRDEITGQVKSIGAWPQQLEGIGSVTARFENPVLIDPKSVIFPDEYTVTATSADVTNALARANGPYTVQEGADVTFVGGPDTPHTAFSWTLGDGTAVNTRVTTHRYADNGLYIAKLTTTVNEHGGVATRHFAAVRVSNVAANVDPGPPITVDEGQEVVYGATFTDPGWLDTHVAVFDFGDNATPAVGAVTETHNPPLGSGTSQATHAYCDNGTYVVTIRVQDDDGGVGVATKRVTVRNVPPTVEAGNDLYAYRCTPITLVARFTDPGWCDTHVGTWDFGDCSSPIPATIRERNKPPIGCGIAAATHRYDCCGDFLATITVLDDDGGEGRDSLVVRVVDVENGGFEGGFRSIAEGLVANDWTPYQSALGVAGAVTARFEAEEFVLHNGERSQRIIVQNGRAGLLQLVGANLSWDYQITAWFHAHEGSGGRYRVGIDPAGGIDPQASSIVWSEGSADQAWTVLSVRATAAARFITIYLEGVSSVGVRPASIWVDDVELTPYPCPLGEPPPCAPPKDRERCIEWRTEGRPRVLGPVFEDRGFKFLATSHDALRIVVWGQPTGTGKLTLPRNALRIDLPFAARIAIARVAGSRPITLRGMNAAGESFGPVSSVGNRIERLEVTGREMTELEFTAPDGESVLIDLCVYTEEPYPRNPNINSGGPHAHGK